MDSTLLLTFRLVSAVGVGIFAAVIAFAVQDNRGRRENEAMGTAGLAGFIVGVVVYGLFPYIFLAFVIVVVFVAVTRFGPRFLDAAMEAKTEFQNQHASSRELSAPGETERWERIVRRLEQLEQHEAERARERQRKRRELEREIEDARKSGEPEDVVQEHIKWVQRKHGDDGEDA